MTPPLNSWLTVGLLDLLATAKKGLTRRQIKDAVMANDERLQIDINPCEGDQSVTTVKTNQFLRGLVTLKYLKCERGVDKPSDVFALTEKGKKHQQSFQGKREKILPPRMSPIQKETEELLPKYSGPLNALREELIELSVLEEDLCAGCADLKKIILTLLGNVPASVLAPGASPHTAHGRVIIKHKKIIAGLRRILKAIDKIESEYQQELEDV